MKIAVIAHIRHAIAEPFAGGMEAHAALLCRGLRDAGHRTTLFAAAGSQDANLVEICPAPYESVLPWANWRGSEVLAAFQRKAFDDAWIKIKQGGFDVVHNNSLFPALVTRAAAECQAMVTSQHVPPFGAMRDTVRAVAGQRAAQITVASNSQLSLWFARPPVNFAVAYNGIDCQLWRPAEARSDRLLWAGRITPNKGLHEAIVAVRAAGATLDIVGPMEDVDYFAQAVAPFLDARICYLGHMRGAALASIMAVAKAVLVTPMWEEPFGLVAAEALACAVPVIAFDRGAMREVVGDCGILVAPGNIIALTDAIGDIGAIDRSACRARALELFSVPAMIACYEGRYAAAIAGAHGGTAPDMSAAASRSNISSTRALLA